MDVKRRKMCKLIAAATLAMVLPMLSIVAQQPNQEIRHYVLPPEVTHPESVAYDKKDRALFVGSFQTQAIARISFDGKESRLLSPVGALFPDVHGLTIDNVGRLWVAGGRSGQIAVLDSHTGRVLKRFQIPLDPAPLVNDVTVFGSNAYFTDTWRPTLIRVTFKDNEFREPEAWLQFTGTPVEYSQGPNLNGIAASDDGRYLILVQTNKGLLFRVGIADKSVAPIDLGGEALTSGDGLVLDRRKLYVMRPVDQEITTIELSKNLLKGRVLSHFKNPALDAPTSARKVGDRLFVANSHIDKPHTTNVVRFELLSIPLSMLLGK
jgi:Cu-Zn family superoxide dismutase